MNYSLAFLFGGIGMPELVIIGIIAVLLFGKRLPEVARSMGKGMVEFKKGIRGIEDDIDHAEYNSTSSYQDDDTEDHVEATAPKFEPPTSEPKEKQTDSV